MHGRPAFTPHVGALFHLDKVRVLEPVSAPSRLNHSSGLSDPRSIRYAGQRECFQRMPQIIER